MNRLKQKTDTGIILLVMFVITLITGIVLHLKSHGIIVEPRAAIKIIHWVAGFAMAIAAVIHGQQFWKPFCNGFLKKTFVGINTGVLIIMIAAVTITGLVKLVSPVKIHGLGLWHYWIGMLMSIAAIIHLVRGVPVLVAMIKAGKKR